eukprot:1355888-Amphidinium_carterae.2
MPPLENLKALVSYAMTEQTDKYKQPLALAVCDLSRAHFVCETCASNRQKNFIERGSQQNSTCGKDVGGPLTSERESHRVLKKTAEAFGVLLRNRFEVKLVPLIGREPRFAKQLDVRNRSYRTIRLVL